MFFVRHSTATLHNSNVSVTLLIIITMRSQHQYIFISLFYRHCPLDIIAWITRKFGITLYSPPLWMNKYKQFLVLNIKPLIIYFIIFILSIKYFINIKGIKDREYYYQKLISIIISQNYL